VAYRAASIANEEIHDQRIRCDWKFALLSLEAIEPINFRHHSRAVGAGSDTPHRHKRTTRVEPNRIAFPYRRLSSPSPNLSRYAAEIVRYDLAARPSPLGHRHCAR
jgi:hypothetical protein